MSVLRAAMLGIAVVIFASAGCGSATPTTPTAPTYTSYSDVYQDGVLVQGATVATPDFGPSGSPHKFTIHQGDSTYPGTISVTVQFLNPPVAVFGIGLSTWNTTNQSCDLPLPYTSYTGTLGVTVSVSVGVPGDYCVALFDVGNVVGQSNYTVTVTHT